MNERRAIVSKEVKETEFKLRYSEIVNDLKNGFNDVSELKFPMTVPVSFHISIVENINAIEEVAKVFWDIRTKILLELCVKDEDGNPIKKVKDGLPVIDVPSESLPIWEEKIKELGNVETKIKLKTINKKFFEGVEGVSPSIFKNLMVVMV